MFNLGYKQVVINDGTLITQPAVPGNQVYIEGFGWFTVGASIDEGEDDHTGDYIAPVLGSTSIVAPTGWTTGDVYTIRLYYDGTRVLSDLWTRGDNMQFQTFGGGPNSGTFAGELTDGMAAAEEDYAVKFNGADTFVFNEGYEGITIRRVTAKKVDWLIDDRHVVEEDITDTIIVEGDEGQGTPRQVEASIRMSTEWSQDPYKIQVGGNESVDFDAEYKEYVWRTREDHESSDDAGAGTPEVPEVPEVLATGSVVIATNAAGDGLVGFAYNGTTYSVSPGAADTPAVTAQALVDLVNGGSQMTAILNVATVDLTALAGSGASANITITDVTTDTTQTASPTGLAGGVDFVPAVPAIPATFDAEWEPHEMIGGGGVNTVAKYEPRRYVVYLNMLDAGFAAADTLLLSLIVTP